MGRLWRPRAFELLPWLPTAAGVVVLVGLLVFAHHPPGPMRRCDVRSLGEVRTTGRAIGGAW